MQNKVKPVLSFIVIGIFLLIAIASFGPDTSTNTTVAIKDCEVKPAVQVQLKITIELDWEDGHNPVTGAFGKLFIVHQKVNPDNTCTFFVESQQTIDFITGQDGTFTFVGNTWTHDNSEDLIRVEVYRSGSVIDLYGPNREMAVRYYSSGNFVFYNQVFPIL